MARGDSQRLPCPATKCRYAQITVLPLSIAWRGGLEVRFSGRCRALPLAEYVAESAHGMDEERVARVRFDLGAQAADIDIHPVAEAVVIVAPCPLDQRL